MSKPVQGARQMMLIEYTHVLASWIDMSSNNSPTVAMSSGFHSPFGADTPAWANNDWYYSIDWRITPTRVLTDSLPSFNVGLVDSIVSDASVWSDLLVAAKSSKVSLKHKYSLFQTSWVGWGNGWRRKNEIFTTFEWELWKPSSRGKKEKFRQNEAKITSIVNSARNIDDAWE